MGPSTVSRRLQKARDLFRAGKFDEASSSFAMLVREFPRANVEYARATAAAGDFELADRIWERMRCGAPCDPNVLGFLAGEYSKVAMYAKARKLWIEAATVEPGNFDIQLQLARCFARTNAAAETRPVLEQCRSLNPQHEWVRCLSAHLDRQEEKFSDAETQFRALLASGPKSLAVHYACHAELAYIFDRTGRYDEAVAELAEGKKFARQSFTPATAYAAFQRIESQARQVIALPKDILSVWSESFPADARCALPATPAFLCGTERSGTTLMERVLDANPAVAACDESQAFEQLRWRIDAAAPVVSAQRLSEARRLYFKNLATVLGVPIAGKTVVDKNPARGGWLPQMLRAFPEMRVLTALRDPRDIVVSLYFQDHANTNCLTVEELAHRYTVLMDLWLAVRQWEGLNWLETRYEDFVANLESEGRRVTKFLGLEWHENQARFHEHNRQKPIMSNNTADVSRPVYKRSAGRWRAYEKQLAPILPVLEPYCRKLGYE